jgi:hypothetical protein
LKSKPTINRKSGYQQAKLYRKDNGNGEQRCQANHPTKQQ